MPQLKHARLKASDACPFSFSVLLSVPTSCFDTHSPLSVRMLTVQNKLPFTTSWLRFQFSAPTTSSSSCISTRAFLYISKDTPLPSLTVPTRHSISSAFNVLKLKLLSFISEKLKFVSTGVSNPLNNHLLATLLYSPMKSLKKEPKYI